MAFLAGIPANHGNSLTGEYNRSAACRSRIKSLALLYLAVAIAGKASERVRKGMPLGIIITLIQIVVASNLNDRYFRSAHSQEQAATSDSLVHSASRLYSICLTRSPAFVRHTVYVALEECVLQVVRKSLKMALGKYLPSPVATSAAVVVTAAGAGAMPILFLKGKDFTESQKLAVLAFNEAVVSGVIAEKEGLGTAVGARITHAAAALTLNHLGELVRENIP